MYKKMDIIHYLGSKYTKKCKNSWHTLWLYICRNKS